jgi:hypothetical protein
VLLPASVILDKKNLHSSPLRVVPQRDRRPCTICDYSFFLINYDTIEPYPEEAVQFGRALLCILQQIAHSDPRLGPVFLSKIDIVYGFYCIGIRVDDVPKLGIIFPTQPGEEPWIGIPPVFFMGWIQSPPLFTSATETVAYLANSCFLTNYRSFPHHLDLVSESPVKAIALSPTTMAGPESLPPLQYISARCIVAFTQSRIGMCMWTIVVVRSRVTASINYM